MSDSYYHAHDLGRFGEVGADAGPLFQKFMAWYGAVFAAGALRACEEIAFARFAGAKPPGNPLGARTLRARASRL